MRQIVLLVSALFLTLSACAERNTEINPSWVEQYPGTWKAEVFSPDKINLLNAAESVPQAEFLNTISAQKSAKAFPFSEGDVVARRQGNKTYLRFPLGKDEQIYGLALNFKTVRQRGRIMRLHVDHYGGTDNGRTHAPVPFYISSRGYGVLINAARYIDIWVGTGVRKGSTAMPRPRDRNTDKQWSPQPESDAIEILIPADGAEVIVFSANSILNVVKKFNLYCGGGFIPPKWGLGFWQRVPTLFTDQDIRTEVEEFSKNGFPLSVIGLEPGWQSKSYPCSYVWDKSRYPQPEKLINDLKQKGIYANLWINPYLSPDTPVYDALKPYTGSHTVWLGLIPDYTIPEAVKIAKDYFTKVNLDIGVSGYKIDECDGFDNWLWPDVATFPSGTDAEQMRQIYALRLQKMFTDMFKDKNERTYGLVRGSNAGSVSFPFVIYNDYYSHRDFITALINSSLCGALWTPEVRSSATGEEWLRRMQTTCFSPLAMINAWADGTKPWSFPSVYRNVTDVAMLHMRLLPYIYTAFARYYFEGLPPFRAMVLETGYPAGRKAETGYQQAAARHVKDQYMMGGDMLVAPVFAGETEREVVFPAGKWYDFYTGKFAGDGEVVTVRAKQDRIPLFVKDGGIIPMMPAFLQVPENKKDIPLEIRHYGKKGGSGILYDDDGKTYAYLNGEKAVGGISVKKDTDGKFSGSLKNNYKPEYWSYGKITWKFMSENK